jgi:ketosteroid isomerase-like protein
MLNAVAARGWDGLIDHCAPDVVVSAPPDLPFGGEWHGAEGIRVFGERYESLWRHDVSVPDKERTYVEEGDVVVSLHLFHAVSRVSGRSVQTPIAEVFRLRYGLIVRLRVFYWDTYALNQAHEVD